MRISLDHVHIFSAALAATLAAVNPSFSITTLIGAEAPKRFSMPTTAPKAPVYFSQPCGTPASTATRARTDGGRIVSR